MEDWAKLTIWRFEANPNTMMVGVVIFLMKFENILSAKNSFDDYIKLLVPKKHRSQNRFFQWFQSFFFFEKVYKVLPNNSLIFVCKK